MRSHRLRLVPCAVTMALAAAFAGAVVPPGSADPRSDPDGADQAVRVEVPPRLDGTWGQYAEVPARGSGTQRSAGTPDGTVTPYGEPGPIGDRLDVVILGDGYAKGERPAFVQDAERNWEAMLDVEPYASYRALFNVWLVDAVSTDSGISRDFDTDPGEVQDKNTALGAYFWCSGIERLVCVDLERVDAYAQLAPEVDLVFVVANSDRYGGAGYFGGFGGTEPGDHEYAGISTLTADHAQSYLIAAHEVGHSLGELADEYQYCTPPDTGPYCQWTEGEVPEPNVTVHGPGHDYLIEHHHKWYRWLDEVDPSGGLVSLYEGGRYYGAGIYRPTADSIMRSLSNVNFNLPGTEAMIDGFYTYGSLLTSPMPEGEVWRGQRVRVEVAEVAGLADPSLTRWYVDGREVVRVRGATSVVPRRLGCPAGKGCRLAVSGFDRTDSIRDPRIRQSSASRLTWRVVA